VHFDDDLMVRQRRNRRVELGDGTLKLFFRGGVIQVLVAFRQLARKVPQVVPPLGLAERWGAGPGLRFKTGQKLAPQ